MIITVAGNWFLSSIRYSLQSLSFLYVLFDNRFFFLQSLTLHYSFFSLCCLLLFLLALHIAWMVLYIILQLGIKIIIHLYVFEIFLSNFFSFTLELFPHLVHFSELTWIILDEHTLSFMTIVFITRLVPALRSLSGLWEIVWFLSWAKIEFISKIIIQMIHTAIILHGLYIIKVLHLYKPSLVTWSHVFCKLFKVTDFSTKLALCYRVITINSIVPNLITLADFGSTSFTHNLHV